MDRVLPEIGQYVDPHISRGAGADIDTIIDDMANHGFGRGTTGEDVYYLTGSWSDHVRSWTTGTDGVPVHVVRYEDLLEHPEEGFSPSPTGW